VPQQNPFAGHSRFRLLDNSRFCLSDKSSFRLPDIPPSTRFDTACSLRRINRAIRQKLPTYPLQNNHRKTRFLGHDGSNLRRSCLTWQAAHCLLQPLFEGELEGVEAALSATSVAEFDEKFTWRANGYASREGYYGAASCGGHVENVNTPLLFVQVRWESVRNHAGLEVWLCLEGRVRRAGNGIFSCRGLVQINDLDHRVQCRQLSDSCAFLCDLSWFVGLQTKVLCKCGGLSRI
jgi:hypothetical protein